MEFFHDKRNVIGETRQGSVPLTCYLVYFVVERESCAPLTSQSLPVNI